MMLRNAYVKFHHTVMPIYVNGLNSLMPNGPQRCLTNRRISHGYKFIYIHIPKTAGTSISKAIDSLPTKPIPSRIVPVDYKYAKHHKAREMKRLLGDAIWNDYFSFAFIRNPWDLMVSSYNWWLQKARQYSWLKNDCDRIEQMGNFDTYIRSHYGQKLINQFEGSLSDWVAEDGKVIVSYVAKFERLHEDWQEVCKRLNAEHQPLPHLNPTKRKPYTEYYTPETRQMVADRFKWVIDNFGYEFG